MVEILETVPADDLVVAACRRLKEAGYTIALDDFAVNDPREALTELADIIKVDLRDTSAADAAAMVKRYGPWRCRMLAEKVETREEFIATKKAGFLYFQGYFFRRPGNPYRPRNPRQPPQLSAHADGSFAIRVGPARD